MSIVETVALVENPDQKIFLRSIRDAPVIDVGMLCQLPV